MEKVPESGNKCREVRWWGGSTSLEKIFVQLALRSPEDCSYSEPRLNSIGIEAGTKAATFPLKSVTTTKLGLTQFHGTKSEVSSCKYKWLQQVTVAPSQICQSLIMYAVAS